MSLIRIKDGLSAISAEVLEDVRKEAETLILKAESEAKETLRAAKEEADKTYKATMKDAAAKVETEKRKMQSLTEVELRNSLLRTKETLVDAAFAKANVRLAEFVKTDVYHDNLVRLIQEATEKIRSKKLLIRVNAADKTWLRESNLSDLSKKMHVELKLAEKAESCVGGCKIETADGKIIYDNTIENRLSKLKPALRAEAAEILFAKEETENAQ
jgi:V/A-type H+-transporting ATPase subunit E